MSSTFITEGRTMRHTAASALTGGQVVVIGDTLAVAAHDIAIGGTGVVYLEGEFSLPKVAGADIGAGESVIWDASAAAFEDSAATPAAGDVTGAAFATEEAGIGATSVKVKLANPGSVS